MQKFEVCKFHMDMLKCASQVKFLTKPNSNKPKITILLLFDYGNLDNSQSSSNIAIVKMASIVTPS